MDNAPIIIIGAGPVGMTLGLELAHHGVRSILVERNTDTTRHPKMDLTNGRTMELYRRLGLHERLRAAGVPQSHPFSIQWATSPTGHLLHAFNYPSPAQLRTTIPEQNDGSGTREPPMRISQIVLEPVLKQEIIANPLIDARFGWAFEQLMQDDDGVSAAITGPGGERESIRGLYLVGCDGAGSRVRKAVDITLDGEDELGRLIMIHFRSRDKDIINPWGPAWHLQTGLGSMVAQDDKEIWTLHSALLPGTDESTIDPAKVLRDFVGRDFNFEILVANPWTPKLLVANRFRRGRVFLAGDSAHQFIPTGGYGMNSGVGDAVDIGWKLAAVANGWGGSGLLDSYDAERRPIALQNRAASGGHFRVRLEIAELFDAAYAAGSIDGDDPASAEKRQVLAEGLEKIGNAENESWGIEHGYRYANSPVLSTDREAPPPFDPLRCSPTTYPGARLPHVRLEDGRNLHDVLTREFTLLVGERGDPTSMQQVAAELGIPLGIVHFSEADRLHWFQADYVLVRPDQHVAWRGHTMDDGARAVLSTAVGRQPADADAEANSTLAH